MAASFEFINDGGLYVNRDRPGFVFVLFFNGAQTLQISQNAEKVH